MKTKIILERLDALSKLKGMNFPLDRFIKACAVYGNPQNTFKSIHVGGTNGKGSVTLKIAKSLELSGFNVGLYTSPHISTFRERIRLNSQIIEEDIAIDYLEDILNKCPDLTFFEVITLLSFLYFRLKKVDYAVIEVGLGGRLDATNVIMPVLSVITSISLDHLRVLGDNTEAIAFEKAGIIKEHISVVLGEKCQQYDIFYQIAAQKNSKVVLAEKTNDSFYDEENKQTAKAALKELGLIDCKGLEARPKCRFETIGDAILDVAHNIDGFEKCFEAFISKYPDKKIHLLMGMSKDKEIVSCLQVASRYVESVTFIPCNTSRGANPLLLLKAWKEISIKPAKIFDSVKEAYEKDRYNLIMGSFYIMDEVRRFLGVIDPHDSIVVCESGQHLEQVDG